MCECITVGIRKSGAFISRTLGYRDSIEIYFSHLTCHFQFKTSYRCCRYCDVIVESDEIWQTLKLNLSSSCLLESASQKIDRETIRSFPQRGATTKSTNAIMTTLDPLFNRLHPVSTPSNAVSTATTLSLLQAAFPDPSTVQNIYTQKLDHRPLNLNPASDTLDTRTLRRQKRQEKLKRKRKPKPLSAREKRELRIYDVPKEERMYGFCIDDELTIDMIILSC